MKLKKLLFSLVTVLFSGIGWFFFSKIFASENIIRGNGVNWIIFVLAMSLSYGFLFLVSLARDRYDFWLTTVISSLWILVFLGASFRSVLSAIAIFVAAQVLMEFPASLERSLNLRYFAVSYGKLALVMLAIIGISSAYIQEKVATNINQIGFSESTSNYVWPYLGKYVAQFNSEKTVDQYVRDEFKSHGVNNPSQNMVNEEKDSISQQVGFDVQGNEKMSELGKRFVAFKVNEIVNNFDVDRAGLYVIFFSLLVLWPVGRFIFAAIAWLIYTIFKKGGAIRITEGQIVTQKLEI
jgi:hypothetical protein